METVGELALWVAIPVAVWSGVVSLLGAREGRVGLVDAGRWGAWGVLGLVAAATLVLAWAFLTNDTGFAYVYEHSSARLGLLQRLTALWAGPGGAQLLWALAGAGVAVVIAKDDGARARSVLMILLAALIGLVLLPDSPFEPLGFAAADGRGLRPELLNPWMAIHPPLLVAGLAALGAGFAISMSPGAGALPERSVERMAGWNRLAWAALSLGLLAGMRWAYGEVGWGGEWSWDPVQSATLLPWLVSTALLHSLPVQRRTGAFARWNRFLAVAAFVCAIVAVAVARSGRFGSIHSFAVEPAGGFALLGLATGTLGLALTVLWRASRVDRQRTEHKSRCPGARGGRYTGNVSTARTSGVLGGAAVARVVTVHALLLAVAGVVCWGLVFPPLANLFSGRTVSVGAPWFEGFVAPAGLVLLLLLIAAPLGRRGLPSRWMGWPAAAGGAAGVGLFTLGVHEPLAVVTVVLGAAALASAGLEVRVGRDGAPWQPRLGQLCGHVGITLLAIGMAGGTLEIVERQSVEPGDEVVIRSALGGERTLRYVGLSSQAGPATWEIIASFRIMDGKGEGSFVDSRQRLHELGRGRGTRAGILPGFMADLRVSLAALDENVGLGNDPELQRASVELSIRPFASWIWLGGLLSTFGVLVSGVRQRFQRPRGGVFPY